MKIHLLILWLIPILGCYGNDTLKTIIEIQVPPGSYDSLSVHLSNEDFTAYSLVESQRSYFKSNGVAKLELDGRQNSWLFLTLFPNKYDHELKTRSRIFLLSRPGEKYRIEFDSSYSMLFRITGDYQEAQDLYNRFYHSSINSMPRLNWNTNTDSLPEAFLNHLEDSINNAIVPFRELLNVDLIDSAYFKSIQIQVQYSHADALLDHLDMRLRVYNNRGMQKYYNDIVPLYLTPEQRMHIETSIFESFPPDDTLARIQPGLDRYLEKYIVYKTRLDFNTTFYSGTYDGKLKNVTTAAKYLDNESVEYYFAKQFGSAFMNQGPDSLATFLYPEYKKRYPRSPYLPGIVECVEGLTGFYTSYYPGLFDKHDSYEPKSNTNDLIFFSPDVEFIEGQDTISSLDSLLSEFKGKNLYIDFWASWCPPCRYEFRFADSLHHFLDANNIEMLYVSFDKDELKWQNVIQNYNLKGTHFRVSHPDLKEELWEIVDFIPTYMIVDTEGKIIIPNAEKPHTKSQLFNQLQESLNLQTSE